MEKDIHLPKSKNTKIPFFTTTIKRYTISSSIIFIIILVLSNLLYFSITDYVINDNIDVRLKSEINKIKKSIIFNDNSFLIVDSSEINEPDFTDITESPLFLQIYNLDKELLFRSKNIDFYTSIPLKTNLYKKNYLFENIKNYSDNLRIGYYDLKDSLNNTKFIIQIATFKKNSDELIRRVVIANIIAFPFLFLLIFVASYYLGKKNIMPLMKIIDTADHISIKNFKDRVHYEADSKDVLGRLRDTLNRLFDRIEKYIGKTTQFTADASHQLLNPLTGLKTELEFILKKDRSTKEYKETLFLLQNQTDKMIHIIKSLLLLSRQENVTLNNLEQVDLSNLVSDVINSYNLPHKIKSVISDNVCLNGTFEQFSILVKNLIDNAVKYSTKSESIDVELYEKSDVAVLCVKDKGIGIPDSEKEKIFDRFYRSEKSEELGIEGNGLGLSIVKSIADEFSGKIEISDNKPVGTIFKVILPKSHS